MRKNYTVRRGVCKTPILQAPKLQLPIQYLQEHLSLSLPLSHCVSFSFFLNAAYIYVYVELVLGKCESYATSKIIRECLMIKRYDSIRVQRARTTI
jgi:hypothetical protein